MALDTNDSPAGIGSSLLLDDAPERGVLRSFARAISQLGSPPVLALTMPFLAAAIDPYPRAYAFAGVLAVVAVVLPMLVLVLQWRAGHVSDLDVCRREERWRPFIASLTGAWLAWLLLVLGRAPSSLGAVAALLAITGTALFAVTVGLGWKISVHSAMAALSTMLVWKLLGAGLPVVIGLPLVMWSRLHLRRHTPAQTLAGAALGLAVVLLAFDTLAGRS
ncbi:hypothetical protein KDL67_09660 [bacterium]|nr:hypothetical protein [bacterium]